MKLKIVEEGDKVAYSNATDRSEFARISWMIGIWLAMTLFVIVLLSSSNVEVESSGEASDVDPRILVGAFGLLGPMVILFIFMMAQLTNRKTIELYLSERRLKHDDNEFQVGQNGTLRVVRRCYVTSSYDVSQSRRKSSRNIEWKLLLDQNEQTLELMIASSQHLGDFWVSQAAEDIAERLKLTLQDETGVEPVVRHVGETDYTLKEYLKAREVKPLDEFQLPEKISTNHSESGFKVKASPGFSKMDGIFVFISIFVFIFLVVLGLNVYIGYNDGNSELFFFGGIAFLLFLGIFLFLFNNIKPSTQFELGSNSIEVRKLGKFFKGGSKMLNLQDYEYITATRVFNGSSVEFVGDNSRYLVPGSFSEAEAKELRDVLESAIRKYCI